MTQNINTKSIWVVVKVDRGFPIKVKLFRSKEDAYKREKTWRRGMNFDYSDTGVFKTKIT